MPSSKVHEAINVVCLPAVLWMPESIERWSFVGGYLFGTFFLSPDLDVETSRPLQRWWLLRWLWLPYSRRVGHRGWSHVPVIGLLLRVAYLAVWLVVPLSLTALAGYAAGLSMPSLPWLLLSRHVYSILLGLLAADLLHVALDVVVTLLKRILPV